MQVAAKSRNGSEGPVTRRWVRDNPRATRQTLRGFYVTRGKRMFSAVLVLALAPMWVPVLLFLAAINAVVMKSLRGAWFSQQRIGRYGRRFRMYKLRTLRDGSAKTRFGSFLRRTHLDELPQLWNVLRGDMCLVGPRPETVAIEAWANRGVPGFSKRLRLRPGITGLAQVTQGHVGPELEGYREKLRLNEIYLAQISFWSDLRVLLRTAGHVLGARGA